MQGSLPACDGLQVDLKAFSKMARTKQCYQRTGDNWDKLRLHHIVDLRHHIKYRCGMIAGTNMSFVFLKKLLTGKYHDERLKKFMCKLYWKVFDELHDLSDEPE